MTVECKVVEGVGKKSGKPYTALEIDFGCDYKKMVFLDDSEKALLNVMKVLEESE